MNTSNQTIYVETARDLVWIPDKYDTSPDERAQFATNNTSSISLSVWRNHQAKFDYSDEVVAVLRVSRAMEEGPVEHCVAWLQYCDEMARRIGQLERLYDASTLLSQLKALGNAISSILDEYDTTDDLPGTFFGVGGELRANTWARLDLVFTWMEEIMHSGHDWVVYEF